LKEVLPKSDFWSEKNTITPDKVFKNTNNKYWFECYECNHSFESSLNHISCQDRWCPYCSNCRLCDDKCKYCFNNSFASNPKSDFWSDKNTITPDKVSKCNGNKYWFECYECNHSFESALSHISNERWCSNPPKKLCNNENCKSCFEKSFANHPNSVFWSNKNELQPYNVFFNSANKYWFECYECNHSFEMKSSSISSCDQWCPYCSNNKLCNDNKCEYCFNKSFASHPKSIFWSDKNNITPTKYSNNKYWFECYECNQMRLSGISYGSWCSFCKKKTELKLFNWLKEKNFIVIRQAKFEWCKNINHLPYDFLIENLNLIIELDGPQHFSNWDFEETQKNDKKKDRLAIENGYSMIRISQEIVWNELEDWQNQLINTIKNIKNKEIIKIGKVYFNEHILEALSQEKRGSEDVCLQNPIQKI